MGLTFALLFLTALFLWWLVRLPSVDDLLDPPYQGGFTTKDPFGKDAVWLRVEGDEDGVHLHSSVSAGTGGGSASSYTRMSPTEAFELAGALENAARAALELMKRTRA